jgi:hypothetical protein
MKELGIILPHFFPSHSTSFTPVITLYEQQILKMKLNNLPEIKFTDEQWPLLF